MLLEAVKPLRSDFTLKKLPTRDVFRQKHRLDLRVIEACIGLYWYLVLPRILSEIRYLKPYCRLTQQLQTVITSL